MMCSCVGCSSIARLNFLAADRLPFVERSKMTTVTSIAQLNAAIVAADGVTAPGTVTITLGSAMEGQISVALAERSKRK